MMVALKTNTTSAVATDAHRTASATAAYKLFGKLEELLMPPPPKVTEESEKSGSDSVSADLQNLQLVPVKPVVIPQPQPKSDLERELENLMDIMWPSTDNDQHDPHNEDDTMGTAVNTDIKNCMDTMDTKIDSVSQSVSQTCPDGTHGDDIGTIGKAHEDVANNMDHMGTNAKGIESFIEHMKTQADESTGNQVDHSNQTDVFDDIDMDTNQFNAQRDWKQQVPNKKTSSLQDGFNFTRDFLLLAGVGLGDHDDDEENGLSLEMVASNLSSRTTSIAFAGVAAHDCVDRLLATTLSKALGRQVLPPKAMWHIERDFQCQEEIRLLHDPTHNERLYPTNDEAPCLFSDIGEFWRPEVMPIVKELERKPWLAPDALAGLLMERRACRLSGRCLRHQKYFSHN